MLPVWDLLHNVSVKLYFSVTYFRKLNVFKLKSYLKLLEKASYYE